MKLNMKGAEMISSNEFGALENVDIVTTAGSPFHLRRYLPLADSSSPIHASGSMGVLACSPHGRSADSPLNGWGWRSNRRGFGKG
jgi:hypothetical protein